jgi:NDP-sugar pyrophosphorylase family protein
MHAIILADRAGHELWPLSLSRPVSLLPVGNKTLLQITIEELFEIGIRSATLISHRHTEMVEKTIGDGAQWGFSISHLRADHPLSPEEALELAGTPDDGGWLMVRGDMLRPFGFLAEALQRRGSQISADIFMAMGIAVPPGAGGTITDISWSSVEATCKLEPCSIGTVATYHRANIMALQGLVPGLRLHGRPAPDRVTIGRGSRVLTSHVPETTVAIGDFCLIERGAVIGPNVSIGSNAIISTGADLADCVVLPGTYVGRDTTMRNAIIDGDILLSVEGGISLTSPSPAIFGGIQTSENVC